MSQRPNFVRTAPKVQRLIGDASSELTLAEPRETTQKFGNYEIAWEIRRDALSVTYAASTDNIEKLLALRVFSERLTDAAQVRSIQKAANKAAELTHVNLATVYENGIGENGAPYMVTDLVEGETLAEVFQVSKRLDIGRFLNIFNQACDALTEAHSSLLIHGNLSPNKIIIESNDFDTETVKLIDFGMPPDPVQNAFYLSPEQRMDAQRADAKTDIYSLGCVMHEALTGAPPFIGHKISQTSLNYLHELANQYSPQSPEHNALKLLDCIIIKCLQQNPAKRFRSIRELMDALRLVNECVCGGNTRKLPPKAEKLLLFRFLDFFDKKIVASMFAYILVAGVSVKFIGETQLQKYIDEAQLAKRAHLPLAQEYWHAAIQQAESIGKPPSLLADLHWELADTLRSQSQIYGEDGLSVNPELSKDAIKEYEKARKYFGHGLRYRSYELDLLKNIASLWMSINSTSELDTLNDKTLKDARALLAAKKYEQCAQLCSKYLQHHSSEQIAYIASSAYNELGITLEAKKGLPYFERAMYYINEANADDIAERTNLGECMRSLKLNPNLPLDHLKLAREATERGDREACSAELFFVSPNQGNGVWTANEIFSEYKMLNSSGPNGSVENMKNAIQPLEAALKIEEQSFGTHSVTLAPTLTSLAYCYRAAGLDDRAIETFQKLFALTVPAPDGLVIKDPTSENTIYENGALLHYVDLLAKNKKYSEATTLLEKAVMHHGSYNTSSPLFLRLCQAYHDAKMTDKAHYAACAALKATREDAVEIEPATNH